MRLVSDSSTQFEDRYRHELKYLISEVQHRQIQHRLQNLVSLDSHVNESGVYNIRSLYFDDYYNRCYYENLSGTDPREKYRIRIYNHNPNRITLECKRKERGKTLKTSCPITMQQYEQIVNVRNALINSEQNFTLTKLIYEMKIHRMRPVVIVEYDRIPYVYKNGNVRITLDSNISSSSALNDFFKDIIPKRQVMPTGMQLLEVKYDEYLPDFIYRALQLESLQQTAYSKYFLCRKYRL